MSIDLLPNNATDVERDISAATDSFVRSDPSVSIMRGIKLINPPPSFLPYLVYEYGLGELTPYVPNLTTFSPRACVGTACAARRPPLPWRSDGSAMRRP